MTDQPDTRRSTFLIDDFSDTELVEYAIANIADQYAGLPGSGVPTIVRYDGTRWVVDADDQLGTWYMPLVYNTIREKIGEQLEAGRYDDFNAQQARAFKARLGNTKSIESIDKYTRKQLRRYGAEFARGSLGDATTRWYFNCENGTYDLYNDALIAHEPAHYITQVAPVVYNPQAVAPTFIAFIERIIPDPELRAYVQELLGYCLNGHMRDPVLPLFIGTGANGKSTLLNTVRRVMGDDYAIMAAPDLFAEKGGDQHPAKRMALKGKRFAITNETGEGMRLNEAAVKQFTSTEPINARGMRQDPITFDPSHMVFMSTNYAPVVRGGDEGLWRRIKEIPFDQYIPFNERDTSLEDKLIEESPGILNWLIEGHRRWLQRDEKFDEPPRVTEATAAYRKESDPIDAFMREHFDFGPDLWTPSATIWSTFNAWADNQGMTHKPTQNGFMSKVRRPFNLVERKKRHGGSVVRGWQGLEPKRDPDGDAEPTTHNTPSGSPGIPQFLPDRAGVPADAANDMYVDIETIGLSPVEGAVKVITIGFPGEGTTLYDERALDTALEVLRANTDRTLVAHNAAFELYMLEGHLGYVHQGPVFCTMVAAQIADAGRKPPPAPPMFVRKTKAGKDVTKADKPFSLRSVVFRITGRLISKEQQVSDWSGELTDEQIEYAKLDVDVLRDIVGPLRRASEHVGTCELDMRNVKVSAGLHVRGVRFDADAWLANAEPHKAAVQRIDARLDELNGEPGNWNSNPQKLALAKRYGVKLPNAQVTTFKAHRDRHEVVALLADRAEHYKAATTYGDEFVGKYVDPDGRIRTSYKVYGAATGRYSSSQPNLQNIPRDNAYRACFKPDEGRFVIADFSQIEVRYAAAFSGDKALQDALATGDVYRATARKMLDIPDDEPVTKEQRQRAKAVVLGLQYGMGATKLRDYAKDQYDVELTLSEAASMKDRFFQAYPTLKQWQRDTGDPFDYNVPRHQQVADGVTPLGRVRRDIHLYTERVNFPIQGAAADAQKLALARLYEAGYDVVMHVHDEIIVECAEAEAPRVAMEMQAIMEQAALDAQPQDCKVSVPAEPSVGTSWADKS